MIPFGSGIRKQGNKSANPSLGMHMMSFALLLVLVVFCW
jgi:hypothetical protein